MHNNTKSALAASVGGALEWYDFIIYGFFTEVLGRQFFPATDEYSRHLWIFGVFAVGYLARSLGGLFFGHIGDKHGRIKSLSSTMFIGGIATVCMALMPGYTSLGITASLLFMLSRIVQGLTIGANISGAIVYIAELTTKKTRGFWVSTVFLGTQRGVMLAGVVSAVLLSYLTTEQLHRFGWRIAFLVGVLVMAMAWYFKGHLVETPYHLDLRKQNKIPRSPIILLFTHYKAPTLAGMGLTTVFSISLAFMLFYMPTFLHDYNFSRSQVIHATFFNICIFSAVLPVFGWVSDRIGPRCLLTISASILIVIVYPCTGLIIIHEPFLHYLGLTLLNLNLAAIATTIPVLLAGVFPTAVRYTGVGFSYNVCQSFFVGMAPLLFTVTGHYLQSQCEAIAIFFSSGAIISLLTLLYVRPERDWLHLKEQSWGLQNEYPN